MKDNFDFEIEKRLKNKDWDKKIHHLVHNKIDRKKKIDRFKIVSILLFLFILSFSFTYQFAQFQKKEEEQILTEWIKLVDDELENFSDITLISF